MSRNVTPATATADLAAWATARYDKYLAAAATDAEAIAGVRQDMLALAARPAPRLTRAAKRDLVRLAAGENMRPCYGPLVQLLDAGYVTATLHGWDCPVVTDAGRQAAHLHTPKEG